LSLNLVLLLLKVNQNYCINTTCMSWHVCYSFGSWYVCFVFFSFFQRLLNLEHQILVLIIYLSAYGRLMDQCIT